MSNAGAVYSGFDCTHAFRLYNAVKLVMLVMGIAAYHRPAGSAMSIVIANNLCRALLAGKAECSVADASSWFLIVLFSSCRRGSIGRPENFNAA